MSIELELALFAVLCFVCAIGILFYGLSRANEFNYREAERKDGEEG